MVIYILNVNYDLIMQNNYYRIERSRTLVPQLITLSEEDSIRSDDIYECYSNLFTIKNLNLVHIICHDKGSHMNNFRNSDLK